MSVYSTSSISHACAGVWAGLSLGGSFIAAPAKFQAQSLTMPVALDVGRAQFHWLGITEGALCGIFIGCLAFKSDANWRWPLAVIAVMALQRLVIMPTLDERTISIIEGTFVEPSHLHVLYVAIEVIKFLLLVAIAAGFLNISRQDKK